MTVINGNLSFRFLFASSVACRLLSCVYPYVRLCLYTYTFVYLVCVEFVQSSIIHQSVYSAVATLIHVQFRSIDLLILTRITG